MQQLSCPLQFVRPRVQEAGRPFVVETAATGHAVHARVPTPATPPRLPEAALEGCCSRSVTSLCLCVQIAVRSDEPFRLQCYSFLRSVAPDQSSDSPDFLGAPAWLSSGSSADHVHSMGGLGLEQPP